MAVTFDTIVTVDWSGGIQKPAKPTKDAIWASVWQSGAHHPPEYFRSRQAIEPWLDHLIKREVAAGRRTLIGFDFAFGYPQGFGAALTGSDDPLAVWAWFERHVIDAPKSNNRYALASDINKRLGGCGPFWGCQKSAATAHLSTHKSDRDTTPFAEKRKVEDAAKGAFTVWQLAYPGSVGSQVIMGLPVLQRLRTANAGQIAVWPFEPLNRPVAFVEVWPSLYKSAIAEGDYAGWINDAAQVHVLTNIIANMPPDELADTLNVPATPEGWIFGVAP